MKTNPTCFKVFLLAALLMMIGKFGNAQNFNLYIANDHLVSPNIYEFDIMITSQNTPFNLRTVQNCVTFNSAFINGATVVASLVPLSTGMGSYSVATVQFSATAPGMQSSANTGALCSNGTLITSSASVRVATFRLTAAAGSFGCAAANPSIIQAPDPSAPGLALKAAVTRWSSTDCSTTSSVAMTGDVTKFSTQTLYTHVQNLLPTITSQPTTSTTTCSVGGQASFSISATGNGLANPLSYQWYENGLPLTDGVGANATYLGSQSATLQISSPSINLNGFQYSCQVLQCSPSLSTTSTVSTLTVNNTNDGNPCTIDVCIPNGTITHSPVNADDANVCTIDACDPVTGPTHTAISVDDNDACTTDGCDPATGATHTAISVNDNDACTTDGCDPATGATHTAISVNDNDACTTDGCDPATGATHTAISVDDNDACTTDGCDPSTGATHTAISVDDNDACTTDGCDPSTGATHTAISVDDNDACTTDGCDPSTGATHTAISVDDNDACTTDGCDPATGATHTAISVDDNDACTTDSCDPSTGATHTAISVDDNNVCTTDGCDPSTGATHTAINVDDNDACTTDGCDPSTGATHTAINVSDNNPCTDDVCDPSTGLISNTPNIPVATATADAIACYNGSTSVTVAATGGHSPYSGTGNFPGYAAGTWNFSVSDAGGCPAVDASVIIANPTRVIASGSSVCSGSVSSSSASATGGTGTYSFAWRNGSNVLVGNTANVSGLATGTYVVTATDGNGCTSTASVVVPTCSGCTTPGTPGVISGPTVACRAQCGFVYNIAPVANATSYIWVLPLGATGSSTGTSITVCFDTKFKGGYICVKAVSGTCVGAGNCLYIQQLSNSPNTPGAMSGPATLCPSASATYSVASATYATSYVWSTTGGLVVTSGQGSPSVVITASTVFTNGSVKVYAKNCKGNSATMSKNVTGKLAISTGITGSSSVCKSQTKNYSISSVVGAISYTWSVTGGATIYSGQGTPSAMVKFTTATSNSAIVKVVANNGCGVSAQVSKSVSVYTWCKTEADGNAESIATAGGSLTAYPNPTTGKATIIFTSESNANYSMKVVDMLGKVLISETISAVEGKNTKDIDLDNVAQGMYFISIQTEGNVAQTIHLIVE